MMQKKEVVLNPPPLLFIKSISEQGYTLSTAMADLIDNSVAAGATRVEILVDTAVTPLKIYIADDGKGMDGDALTMNMRFPSADMDEMRSVEDMGRFGLGLKTASFSQSRKFTVISRTKKGVYGGRTWDVGYLKQTGEWTLKIVTDEAITDYIADFSMASAGFHSRKPDFQPNTVIIWDELYKLNRIKKDNGLEEELEELRGHIGLVFHRYIQTKKLEIRLNNMLVQPFDPFPTGTPGIQTISEAYWETGDNEYIRFQGIILPKSSEQESREDGSVWATHNQTLADLQGIYVYRNERLINYGGWLRTIPKSTSLQFGRIRIDIRNIHDQAFQLNVAKSSLKIPTGLKKAMLNMIKTVAAQANREYRERVATGIIKQGSQSQGLALITKETSASGTRLKVNPGFEILRQLTDTLGEKQRQQLDVLICFFEKKLNQVWSGDADLADISSEDEVADRQKIVRIKSFYESNDYSWEEIRQLLIDTFGSGYETISFIDSLKN